MGRSGWSVILGVLLVALVAAFFWQLYEVNDQRLLETVYLEMPLIGLGPVVDLFDLILFASIYGLVAGVLLTLLFCSGVLASVDRGYRKELRGLKEQLLETREKLAQVSSREPERGTPVPVVEAPPAASETEPHAGPPPNNE